MVENEAVRTASETPPPAVAINMTTNRILQVYYNIRYAHTLSTVVIYKTLSCTKTKNSTQLPRPKSVVISNS